MVKNKNYSWGVRAYLLGALHFVLRSSFVDTPEPAANEGRGRCSRGRLAGYLAVCRWCHELGVRKMPTRVPLRLDGNEAKH